MIPVDAGLKFVLSAEGGYVNDPSDHGGATDHGITQHTYDAWRTAKGLPLQDVRDISDSEVRNIYIEDYWQPAHCSDLPPRTSICTFDCSVNSGPSRAIKILQAALGVPEDGIWGITTKSALAEVPDHELAGAYLDAHRTYYRAIVAHDPSQEKFLNGWLARVDHLQAYLDSL